jgi:hypothetical protein
MTTKRKLRVKRHIWGANAGQALTDWLNCEGDYRRRKRTPAHRRIEGLLREWHSLVSRPASYWNEQEFDQLEALQRKFSRYQMTPQIDEKRMGSLGMRFTWNPGSSDEAKAVLVITLLGERGLLWRVRRCAGGGVEAVLAELGGKTLCGRWFYARRQDERFCSLRCRQRSYARKTKTPAGRSKRAAYMRSYRADLRDQDERGFAQFGRQRPNRRGKR